MINKIPKDKLLHFAVGFLIAALFTILFSSLIALIITIIIAVCKELYDKYIKKTFIDYWDIVATVTPSIILLFI